MAVIDRLRELLGGRRRSSTQLSRLAAPIPPEIARRLRSDNPDDPLFPKLRAYGKGTPGVIREREWWWVIRDDRGRVVGGAMVGDMGPDHPVSIDVAVDPARQGEGWATRLYEALEERGFDMEAGSAASLAHRSMTPDGYRFMRARREKRSSGAEVDIKANAHFCPGRGPMDAQDLALPRES